MKSRLDGVPIYEQHPDVIAAEHYNTVQIALKRLGPVIRIELPTLRTLDLILEQHDWIVVDRFLNDIPVIAWTDFQNKQRNSLHQPIRYTLKLYHAHAEMIIGKVIEAMNLILGERLADQFTQSEGDVVQLKK